MGSFRRSDFISILRAEGSSIVAPTTIQPKMHQVKETIVKQ